MFLAGFSQALGDFCFSEASRLIYIHMSKPVDSFFFFFSRKKLIMIFASSNALHGLRVWGFPINFYSQRTYFSPSLICKLICC